MCGWGRGITIGWFLSLDKDMASLAPCLPGRGSLLGDSCEALLYNASGIRALSFFGIPAFIGYNQPSLMHELVALLDPMWA